MKKKLAVRAIALSVSAVMGLGFLSACGGGKLPVDKKALVIMTEELNNLYNPFYSTAGTDMEVVGQTQISMLTTDSNGNLVAGENEPTVALAWDSKRNENNQTEYYYVLKNGIKFSDGVPLTMNDVLFNLYVYLDPAYTGSTTMYSTDIVGLQTYRNQTNADDGKGDTELNSTANEYATNRVNDLVDMFKAAAEIDKKDGKHTAAPEEVLAYIDNYPVSYGYQAAIGVEDEENALELARAQMKLDYQKTISKFREELERDYNSAKSSYLEEPYKSAPVTVGDKQIATGFDEVTSFMYMEGFVTLEYPQAEGSMPDKTKIEAAKLGYDPERVSNMEEAINYVYNSIVPTRFHEILQMWVTGSEMRSEFVAKAKDVYLHGRLEGDELQYKSIEGIQSLGHMSDAPEEVTVAGKKYKVANYAKGGYNDDGTVKNSDEYAVLRIVINKQDPKAQWNFAFTVAPWHYYSDPTDPDCAVNIIEEKYGVKWTDFDFQSEVIQGTNSWGESKNKVPVGAGPYYATNEAGNTDKPRATDFISGNTVYYKRNDDFLLGQPKIDRLCYMVTSSANALPSLRSGQVHFVEPQFTKENADKIEELKSAGVGSVSSWQLGYGYIGINAKYVKQLPLRKAIMSAMQARLAIDFYAQDTATTIGWPMSAVSWAYPRNGSAAYDGANPTANMNNNNGKSWTIWSSVEQAKSKIREYMREANVETGDPSLKIEFTIAGSNMYEHPAYSVLKQAMDILNDCGWEVNLKPDASALTKLSTGSLAVWAAAWGSTIDPDMYQVYHKNSTATSVLAWGYPSILSEDPEYSDERNILNQLSDLIDQGRDETEQSKRAPIYKQAMELVLELAVEFPLYQRKVLYAYNALAIDESSLPHNENGEIAINPYTSPLSRIWEVEFTD